MHNALNWFEIFVKDMPRAQRFYEAMLDIPLRAETFGGLPHAIFPAQGLAGALVKDPNRQPGAGGPTLYLNCNGMLDACRARVAKAGGSVVMPKTDIGQPGFIAMVQDTEGNTVGLHAERN